MCQQTVTVFKLLRMDAGQLLGLSIFASYFLLILWLFLKIASSLRWDGERKGAGTFLVLAAASFAHTWYCESGCFLFSPVKDAKRGIG